MPQIVALPNGEEAEFPDGMPEQEIEAILQKQFGAPKKNPADLFRQQLATTGSFGHTPQPEEMPEGAAGKLAMAGTIASLPLGVQAAGAPLAALRGLAMSAAGASAGGYAGTGLGRGLEMVGAPEGTSETAGTIGGLVGGVAGPVGGPMALAKILKLGGGKAGMLGQIGERLAGPGAASVDAAAAKTAAAAEKEAARAAEREAARKLRERALAVAEERNALLRKRLEMKAAGSTPKPGPKAVPSPRTEGATALRPEPELIPDDAVSLVAEPLPFKPRVKPATNLGGPAKPGPAPTPDDKLAETLQASIDAAKAKKTGAVRGKGTPLLEDALDNASGMHQREATAGMTEAVAARRRAVGSQKVARELGMERHQVQSDAGTILNEALGEVSPVIPEKAWAGIVTKMKSLPPEERVAYVARARGVKNMAQIENLRRTLETLGLLLPLGVAAGSVEQ